MSAQQDWLQQLTNTIHNAANAVVNPVSQFVNSVTHNNQQPSIQVPSNVQGSLAPDPTAGQSAQLTPQVAQQQGQVSNAIANRVATSPGGRFVGSAVAASDPNNGDVYGNAEQQHGGNSPEAAGALIGSAIPALGMPDTTVGADLASVPRTMSQMNGIGKDAIAMAQEAPGGLQAGFINPSEIAKLPDRPGVILGANGEPARPTIEPQTGGKFVNEAPSDLTGGTPAKIKAKASVEPDMTYIPGNNHDLSPQEPSPIQTPIQEVAGKAPGVSAPSPVTDYTRTYDISSPDYAPAPADQTENIKRNLTLDGNSIRTPQEQQQVNATLNGYRIKGSQADQLAASNDAIRTLATRAKAKVAASGGTISKNDLINEVAKNLFKTSGQHDIDPTEFMQTAEDYVNNKYAQAKGVSSDGTFASQAPDQIPGTDVQQMKQLARGDASSTFGRDPSTWTKTQKVTRPASDAIDALLDEQYPEASKLNNDMSDMYKAQDSLRKGANMEGTAAQKAVNAPKKGKLDIIKEHPVISTLTALGVGPALTYGASKVPWGDLTGNMVNDLTGNSSKGATNNLIMDTSPSSHMNSDDIKKATGLKYTNDDYQRDINDPRYVIGSNFQNTADKNMAQANAIANQNLPGDVPKFMGGAAQQALNAQAKLQKVNLDGLTGVMKRFGSTQDLASYTSSPNNPYAQDILNLKNANLQYTQAVKDVTGSDPDPKDTIQQGDTSEVIKEKLTAQNKFIKDTYKQYQPYWDAKNPTSKATTDTKTYNQNTGGTSIGSGGLPPLPSGFSMQQINP